MIGKKIWLCLWLSCVSMLAQAQNIAQEVNDELLISNTDTLEENLPVDVDSLVAWDVYVREHLAQSLKDKLFETSQLGLMVYDLTADSVLFAHNERHLMRPASTMKVVTAIAALDRLGSNYEFKTQLFYNGTIKNGLLLGDVYCVGGLDPQFDASDMQAFISCIKSQHIDTIRGCLYADKSMKELNILGEGWCWDDDNPILSPLLYKRKDHFMDVFEEQLRANGVVVEAFNASGRLPFTAVSLCLRTHSMTSVLEKMMKESDNLCAEAMFYQLGTLTKQPFATAKEAQKVIKQLIDKASATANSCRIADGSGLSLYNYLSPKLLVNLLKYAYQNNRIYASLKQSLPIAGVDGTLKDRMKDESTRGKIWAKTGTLEGISSLAGYCKAPNGHLLAFAIINQGVLKGSFGRQYQDKVCRILCYQPTQ